MILGSNFFQNQPQKKTEEYKFWQIFVNKQTKLQSIANLQMRLVKIEIRSSLSTFFDSEMETECYEVASLNRGLSPKFIFNIRK